MERYLVETEENNLRGIGANLLANHEKVLSIDFLLVTVTSLKLTTKISSKDGKNISSLTKCLPDAIC